jgi:CBS domain-containing protein
MPRTTLKARDVMTREVISVPSDLPVDELAEFLIERGISGAPVTGNDDELIGVVSMTDIARHDGFPTTRGRRHEDDRHYRIRVDDLDAEDLDGFRLGGQNGTTVRDIMTPAVFGVVEDMPIQDVADYMIRGKIHRQFVTHGKIVVGVITAMDLLKVIRDLPR